jgi:signal transduction histidine kinase
MDVRPNSEPFVNPRLILLGIVIAGVLIYLSVEWTHASWQTVNQTITYTLLFTILAIGGWLLLDRSSRIGKWFTILLLSAALHLWGTFFQIPAALALAGVTIVFAVPVLGVLPATIIAVLEMILILILSSQPDFPGGPQNVIVALVILWTNYAAMLATYQHVRQMNGWFLEYFKRGQTLLDEARDHRAELMQAMEDQAHLTQQLAIMNKRVNDLRVIAEEAQKAKTRFVARVSHEFRTPLNMIIGLVDLITEKPEIYDAALSPRMRDALNTVHRNCQHLADMVNDVLDLSRIETERMVLNKERVDLRLIVQAAVDTVGPLLESKNIHMEIHIAPDLPEVYCDRTRIEQVILNLVSNSARYTEQGTIRVSAFKRAQYAHVRVQDTGLGISKEDLTRIFEPFAQGTSEFVHKKGGSGLGLSISKQFIELHSGRMWVESELGVGSTFTFELPISSPLDPIARPGHHITEEWVWRERRARAALPELNYHPRILVHDETGDLYHLLSRHSGEMDLVNAPKLQQVQEALRDAPAHAVLLNSHSVDEIRSLADAIKREADRTPILGCSIPRSLDHARNLGLLGQLIKPVSREDLRRALASTPGQVRRVLIADDDPDVRDLFIQALRVCDPSLDLLGASNGQEALDLLRTEKPDLLECMASDAGIPKVPTFFVSAQDPYDQPPHSDFLYAATQEGFSVNQILRCSLVLSDLLLHPEVVSDPAPRGTDVG